MRSLQNVFARQNQFEKKKMYFQRIGDEKGSHLVLKKRKETPFVP